MKLSTASTLLAASAAAAVIGMGAPAFASTGAVAHPAKPACVTGIAVECEGIGGAGFVGGHIGRPLFVGERFHVRPHFFPHRFIERRGFAFNRFGNGFFDESDCFDGGF